MYADLIGEVGRDISLGYKVVVGGDFNESLERGNMMESKMREFGLVNLVKTRLDPIPSTRVGSRYAIDHVWCSTGVQSKVEQVVLVPRDQVFLSNHLGIFMDVQIGKNGVERKGEGMNKRYLKSGNKRNREKYLEEVRKGFNNNELTKALDKLITNLKQGKEVGRLEERLNNIDDVIQ